jgi:hypothetical protein
MDSRPAAPISDKTRLVLLSFLMLFVELALIRWLGSDIIYLSYFSNFVLLGSFLGIGIGFLQANSRIDMFRWVAFELALLVAFVLAFPITINRSGSQLIYFGGAPSGLPLWVVLPIVFLAVAAIMASIAQGVARVFARFEPLEAYRLDIIGSLGGIVAFSLLSFLGAPPIAWGLCASVLLAILTMRSFRVTEIGAIAALVIMLGGESLSPISTWSPYYKISIFPIVPGAKQLQVNGIPHQVIEPMTLRKIYEPLYFLPYRRVRSNPLRNVLIIGAGTGGDVAIALAAGAKHVDAVEIDPKIYRLGTKLNPDQPYENPRVTIHIDDGRAFLQRTRTHYDLILFALPDSLELVSGQSSLRLESYLFTEEAIRAARAHLNPGGAFGMYNYYRQGWLLDRYARTLEVAFGHRPCIDASGRVAWFALLMTGLNRTDVTCASTWNPGARPVPEPVTDNYPFPYLEHRSIPPLYAITLAAILVLSIFAVRGTGGTFTDMFGYADLFFMGAAFLLLETKNVVQFALLFGTTWFVNALVFAGILLAVLGAVEFSRRFVVKNQTILYVALIASLAIGWAIDPERLLALEPPLRFAAAAALAFAPIFLANIIFAQRFRDVASSTVAFSANLLGAMVGGIVEYSSLVFGYRNLLIVVAAFYGLAFLLRPRYAGARIGAVTRPLAELGMRGVP